MSIPGTVELGTFPGQQQVHQSQSMKISSAIPIRKRRFPVFHLCSPPIEENNSALGELDAKNKEESNVQDGVTLSSEAKITASLVKSDATKNSVEDVKIEVIPLKPADKDFLVSMPVEAKPITSLGPLEDLGNRKVILRNEKFPEPEVPSSAIPLKKRRFMVFHPCSPPREEKISALEDLSLMNKEEFNIQAGGTSSSEANNAASLVKWDVTEKVISQNDKSAEPQAPDSSIIAQTANIKQEIVCEQTDGTSQHELSRGKMNVKLSLGPTESDVAALQQQNEVAPRKSDKLDSFLSLALHEEKLVLCDKKQDSAMDSVSNPVSAIQVSANRSNWDLNTTMDVWEGSTCSDAVAHRIVNFGGLNKTDSCHDDESLLTIDSTARHASSSKLSIQQFKMDDSLVLKLAMPYVDTSKEPFSSSDKLHFTTASPNLSSKQMNLSTIVKSEPLDDDSKHDCSIGSSSSSNMGSLKLSSMNRDCANNHRLETMLQSTVSPDKLDGHRSIKSEVVQKCKEETCKSIDAVTLSAERVMQYGDSCAFSSAYAMPVSLLSQGTSPTWLPPCSELNATGDFANISEQSFRSKEFQGNDVPDKATAIPTSLDNNQSRQCKLGISSVVPRIDEHAVESFQNADVSGNVEEKMDTDTKMLEEESLGSDTGEKEDEDIEDGEVREHVLHSADIDPVVEGKKNDSVELVRSDPQDLQLSISSAGQSIDTSVFSEKDVVEVNLDETHGDLIKYHVSVCYETLQEPHEVSDPDGQVDESPREELSCFIPTDGSHGIGIEIGGETTAEVVKEICSGEDNLTSAKVEECLYSEDAAKDFSNSGNKSRIINLPRPSALAAPYKTKSISNRFLTSRIGKERYSDYDEEMQTRGNRKGFYTGGSNKFVKDQSVRNSRPTFMRGKGRGFGRFGSSHGEWDSDHNFASESSYGQSDYRVIRRKYAPSIPDADLDRNGYGFPQDDDSFRGNKGKIMNNEFLSPRRGSLRRVSSGDRDGFTTRGYQMLHRIPRNMSPRRCSGELDNNRNFRGNGNGNFSTTTMQRKGYRRLCSKSPVRSRTRSPGPWSSPRRRCPDELPEHSQHRSPSFYRMGRVRSNDHNACFHDDMVPRRRGSPYAPRLSKDLGDVDSEREHIERRAVDSNRRGSFARSNRRADALDLRELDDGNEYLNRPSHSNRYHELHGDGSIDNGSRFKERRGPKSLFRPNFNNNNDNFRFHHPNNGPRPSNRFWQHSDSEFVERSNAQKGEFEFVEGNAEEREFERRGEFVERSSAQERELEFVERGNAEEMEYHEREFVEGGNAQEREFDGQMKHWVMEGR